MEKINPLNIKAKQVFTHLKNEGMILASQEKPFNIGFAEGVIHATEIYEKKILELAQIKKENSY